MAINQRILIAIIVIMNQIVQQTFVEVKWAIVSLPIYNITGWSRGSLLDQPMILYIEYILGKAWAS